MEALLVDHTAEGNEECCRLTSVVGSTIWFYENKLNSSIRERITFNIYLREGSVISEHHLDAFAARYINAINVPAEAVTSWYEAGAPENEFPLAESKYQFSEVMVDGRPLSIFPFTANALDRLYSTLEYSDENNSKRTPRVVLTQIIQQILERWYKLGPAFLSDEKNFFNSSFSIPMWADETYEIANRQLSEDYVVERSLLLRIWGDGTTETREGSIGGVQREIFEAFGIEFPGGSEPEGGHGPEPAEQKPAEQKPAEPKPQELPAPELPKPPKPLDDRLLKATAEINEWQKNNAPLRSHQELREDLVRFIMNNAPWAEWGIPFKLADACVQMRYITVEGQSAVNARQGIVLPRNEETRYLLLALARWRYEGKNSWVFKNALDYYTIAISWLEKHMPQICKFIVRTANSASVEELAELGIVAQYCAKIFAGGFKQGETPEETAISLMQSPAVFQEDHQHLNEWKAVSAEIQNYTELYPLALSFFRKAIGGRRAEEADYMFVDAYDLLSIVKTLQDKKWALDFHPLNPEMEKGLRTTFSDVIALVKSKRKDVTGEARTAASTYRAYFSNEISPELSPESISAVVQEMKAFLLFLTQHNFNYSRALEDSVTEPHLDQRLNKALKDMRSVLDCSDEESLPLLSTVSFDDVDGIYKLFVDFTRLLNEKDNTFVSGINQTLQDEIDNGLYDAKAGLSKMQNLVQQLMEV